jgi:hypothetical protein
MDDDNNLFLIHIMDGYSFRNMIGIIKSEVENITMILSQKEILISFVNITGCAIHKIVLNVQEFSIYRYNYKEPQYQISLSPHELFNTTKTIGKKDGIIISLVSGDNKLNIQPIKISTKDPGRSSSSFVNILNKEYKRYEIPEYNIEPNIRVQAKDFADLCSQANTLKCNIIEIIGYNDKIKFKSILSNNTVSAINTFTSNYIVEKIENKTEIEEVNIKVPISTIKALSKIHNISPSGTLLKFYFLNNKPIKIESPIGIYGTYTICIKSYKI